MTEFVHVRVRECNGGQESCLVKLSTGKRLFSVVETDYEPEDGSASRLNYVSLSPAKGIPTYMLDCKGYDCSSYDAWKAAMKEIRKIERRRLARRPLEDLFCVGFFEDSGVEVRYAKRPDEYFPGDDPDEEDDE